MKKWKTSEITYIDQARKELQGRSGFIRLRGKLDFARRRYADKMKDLSTVLSEARRTRNTQEGYRLAHLREGRKRRPRKRRYGHLPPMRATATEDFLTRAGADGGLTADFVEFESDRDEWVRVHRPLPRLDQNHFDDGIKVEPQGRGRFTKKGRRGEAEQWDLDMTDAIGEKGKGGKKPPKKNRKKKQASQEARLILMAKAALQIQQEQRSLISAVYNIFTVKSDSPEANKMKEQRKAYSETAKENPKHDNGPPHFYQFLGLLTALKEEEWRPVQRTTCPSPTRFAGT